MSAESAFACFQLDFQFEVMFGLADGFVAITIGCHVRHGPLEFAIPGPVVAYRA